MSTRTAKQLIYGALYLIMLFVILGGFYLIFIRPFATAPVVVCTPTTCAPTSTVPLTAALVSTFSSGSGSKTFLGEITNANVNFGAPAVSYELDLDDASGTVLQSVPGTTFVYDNQTKYVLVPNVTVAQPYDHAVFVVDAADWSANSAMGVAPSVATGQFSLQNIVATAASTSVSVGGVVTNTSVASYRTVVVLVLFKDTLGNVIGGSDTQLDSVSAGKTVNFSVIYPAVTAIDPSQNQILVYGVR